MRPTRCRLIRRQGHHHSEAGDGRVRSQARCSRALLRPVTLGPVRLLKEMGDIAEAVIAQLSRAGDANVSITVEIEAIAPKGFSDDIQRAVTENARTLKFDTQEFEAE